jgi:hypothetical protein
MVVLGGWVCAAVILSQVSGWRLLASRYRLSRNSPRLTGHTLIAGWGRVGPVLYGGLIIGSLPHGIVLRTWTLMRPGHPRLFIPWREISWRPAESIWDSGIGASSCSPTAPHFMNLRFDSLPEVPVIVTWSTDLHRNVPSEPVIEVRHDRVPK